MNVRLLNNGNFSGLENVEFPVDVVASSFEGGNLDLYYIPTSELIRIGGDPDFFESMDDWPFSVIDGEVISLES